MGHGVIRVPKPLGSSLSLPTGSESFQIPPMMAARCGGRMFSGCCFTPRQRRDCPVCLELRPVPFPGLRSVPLAHPTGAQLRPPQDSPISVKVSQPPEQEAENVSMSYLLWAKVCLTSPCLLQQKVRKPGGVYLTPSLLSSTERVLPIAFQA